MSMLLNCFLFFKTEINAFAPSLSISLLESWSSYRQPHFEMNSQMFLHPFEEILLSERLRTFKLYFFLVIMALMMMATPSSPMLFPLRLSSFTVLLKVKTSSRAFIPWRPISFFLKLKTSRYFLSFKDAPIATAPSAKTPLVPRESSVIYFLFYNTLLTALAPPGPMKLFESISSLKVD